MHQCEMENNPATLNFLQSAMKNCKTANALCVVCREYTSHQGEIHGYLLQMQWDIFILGEKFKLAC